MTVIALATEGALSQAVAERLIGETNGRLHIGLRLGLKGFGYLRSNISKFLEMSRYQPVLVITDLDQQDCPAALVQDWLGRRVPQPDLLLRVAVREIESWVLADHESIRTLLDRPQLPLPHDPDTLPDPKASLVKFATRGPRWVREGIVPEVGVVASQALGYNEVLVPHVKLNWDPGRAASRSDSLRRTRRRIQHLADRLG